MFKYKTEKFTYYHNNVTDMQKCITISNDTDAEHTMLMKTCYITVSNMSDNIVHHNVQSMTGLLDGLFGAKLEFELNRDNLCILEQVTNSHEFELPGDEYYEALEIVEDEPDTYGITESKDEWTKSRCEFDNLNFRAKLKFLSDIVFNVTPHKYMTSPTACDNGVVLMAKTKKFDSLDELVKSMPITKWYLYDVYQDDTTKNYFVRYAVCLS